VPGKTTDNFLPYNRLKSSYISRPITYVHREPQPDSSEILVPASMPVTEPSRVIVGAPAKRTQHVKRHLIWAMATILLVLGIAASAFSFKSTSKTPGHTATTTPIGVHKTTASATPVPLVRWPVRLKIPAIGVDASLEYVRLTASGALAAPATPATAGWYDKGPRPGERGNAVIDGHFGWKNAIPAVFDNLHKLQKGDSISVIDEKGATIHFVVRATENYTENQAATAVFTAQDNGAHLNLITCGGTWNAAKASYTNRLVVFADKQ